MAIPSRPTLVAAEPGRCINKEDTQSEGQSCSLPLRSHPWLWSLCVFLQMNLFLFCAMCARPIKISSSASRVGKGRCKKKKEKRQTSLLSPPPQPLAALSEPSSYFSPAEDAAIHPDFHAHTHSRARAHTQLVSCPSSILRFPPSGCGCCFMHGGSSTSPWLHYERETEVGWKEAAAQELTMWRVEEVRLTEVRMKGAPVCCVKPFLPPSPSPP